MARFGNDCLATIEFTLRWSDGGAEHEERYLARRVNAWRDIFPPGLKQALEGKGVGDGVVLDYGPGEALEGAGKSRPVRIPMREFHPRRISGRTVGPKTGRFYPQGMLTGIGGVYPTTIRPFRILEMDNGGFIADLNHPLAGFALSLEARIVQMQDKESETGGRLSHWMEQLCNFGPGMQAMLPGKATEFFDEEFFQRQDSEADGRFYSGARIVGHIDRQASDNLQEVYSRRLRPGMRVLDLMSSVESHLPGGMNLEVTGLGLNLEELEQNPLLSDYMIHDLNQDPEIRAEPESFDAVVCSLSIEYLTDPVAVLESAHKLLVPGGVAMIGVSNRFFPTKAVYGWLDLHEFERMGLVRECLRRAGFAGPSGTASMRNDWRPTDDRHFLETRGVSDPVYAVWGYKAS